MEFAAGVSSAYSPFSSRWTGAVREGGLYFKEYAFRATYRQSKHLAISAMVGFLDKWNEQGEYFFAPEFGGWSSSGESEVSYFAPSFELTAPIFRIQTGAILYRCRAVGSDGAGRRYLDDPFDKESGILPSLKLGLGEPFVYIYAAMASAFPLYAGSVYEIGIEAAAGGYYEQKFYIGAGEYESIALGYRGEFKISGNTSFSCGIRLGGSGNDNVYTFSLGLKRRMSI
jgi:hypothetical protein